MVRGEPGKGLTACEATSTLTVSPTRARVRYSDTLTAGLEEATTSTGTDPDTELPSVSVTLTAMLPAWPRAVS